MKARAILVIVTVAALTVGGGLVFGQHGAALGRPPAPPTYTAVPAAILTQAGLPSEEMAKTVLSAALMHRHPQWIDIPAGSTIVRSFVVFPERPDNAPVLVISSNTQGMSDWLRAVGDDAAAQGFIAVVPDLLTGLGPNGGDTYAFDGPAAIAQALAESKAEIGRRGEAVTKWAVALPSSNGKGASVRFDFVDGQGRIEAAIESPDRQVASFKLADHAWHTALAFLAGRLDAPAARQTVGPAETGPRRAKEPHLPANYLQAMKTMAQSPRKGEWVDIPMPSGIKLHTWISYPQGATTAPVVVVIQPAPGMDLGEPPTKGAGANWMRGTADQLASEGFIAVVPDLTSGAGPNGGNFDSFQYPDDPGEALRRIPRAEIMNRIRIAGDYGLKLSMANGKLGATGYCGGGALAWEAAAELPAMNAAVSFYGAPPPEAVMARIHAPVAAFIGEQDVRLAPMVPQMIADMKRLGKEFSVQSYKDATHAYLYRQELARNYEATADSWPKMVAFFKKHLMSAAATAAR